MNRSFLLCAAPLSATQGSLKPQWIAFNGLPKWIDYLPTVAGVWQPPTYTLLWILWVWQVYPIGSMYCISTIHGSYGYWEIFHMMSLYKSMYIHKVYRVLSHSKGTWICGICFSGGKYCDTVGSGVAWPNVQRFTLIRPRQGGLYMSQLYKWVTWELHPRSLTARPWKMVVRKILSILGWWIFRGELLNFGG